MTDTEELISIEMGSVMEIPLSYDKAITKYIDDKDNAEIWNATIELLSINFQRNFRREEYVCNFKITLGG